MHCLVSPVDESVQPASSPDLLIDSLDLLSDLLSRFESTVKTLASLQSSVLKAATPLLNNGRAAVRKRAVATLGTSTSFSGAGADPG